MPYIALSLALAQAWSLLATLKAGADTPPVFNEFPVPTADSGPYGIATAADGNLWFTEFSGNKVAKMTTSGLITEYPVPTANSGPAKIVAGPDGNLWFTEYFASKIGRITTAGAIQEFPTPTADGKPNGISLGPNGTLYFVESNNTNMARIDMAGAITEYPLPVQAGQDLDGIVLGPDGNMWVPLLKSGAVARVSPTGTNFTSFPVPVLPVRSTADPLFITNGPDGNLWFTENNAGAGVGKITPAGVATVYETNRPSFDILAGPDGKLYFSVDQSDGGATDVVDSIGQVTTAGVVRLVNIPTHSVDPLMLTIGPDNNLWFVEKRANKIARLVLSSLDPTTSSSTTTTTTTTTTTSTTSTTSTSTSTTSTSTTSTSTTSTTAAPASSTSTTPTTVRVATTGWCPTVLRVRDMLVTRFEMLARARVISAAVIEALQTRVLAQLDALLSRCAA